jgi:hypothetical protein
MTCKTCTKLRAENSRLRGILDTQRELELFDRARLEAKKEVLSDLKDLLSYPDKKPSLAEQANYNLLKRKHLHTEAKE